MRPEHHQEVTVGRIKPRSIAQAIALATAASLVTVGCGVADKGAGGGDGELTLWTHNAGNKEELAVVKKIVADYNASQDEYEVKVQAFPQETYNSAVVSAATANKLPCILDTDAPTVPNWAYAGFLAPLDLPQELVDKNLDSTLGIYDDKLYSIGYYDAALGLFAHEDALDKAGVRVPTIEDPWTGEEFDGALAKIKASGEYEYAFDLGTGDSATEWWTYGYSPFLQSFGGDLIDRESYETAGGVINGDAAMAWAQWFQGLVEDGYTPAKSSTDAFADFVNGKSAIVWSGIWNSTNMSKVKDAVVLPPPDFGNGPKIGGGSWQWAVSSSCGNKDAAMDYLEFSLDPKYLAEFATEQNVIPATEEAAALAPGWEKGGTKRFFLDESAAFAELRPPTPGYPFLTTTFAKAAQDIVAGGDAKKILDQAADDIDADLQANDNYGN
jgi:multiple sugar transport system substrate-binding protein